MYECRCSSMQKELNVKELFARLYWHLLLEFHRVSVLEKDITPKICHFYRLIGLWACVRDFVVCCDYCKWNKFLLHSLNLWVQCYTIGSEHRYRTICRLAYLTVCVCVCVSVYFRVCVWECHGMVGIHIYRMPMWPLRVLVDYIVICTY